MLKMWVLLPVYIILFCSTFANAQIAGANVSSEVCFSCHKEQAKDWKTTWHSRSHVDSNPLYKAVVSYISKVSYMPEESVLVECAQCHNPKMTIKHISNESSYSLAKVLNIETDQTKKVDDSVKDKSIKDGISCNICHNVEEVNETQNLSSRGFMAIKWGPSDTIFGPYEEEGRSGLHKSVQKSHFVDQNKLCMVCHFGGEKNGVQTYATGSEYIKSADKTKCVGCHMSPSKDGIISPEIIKAGVKPKVRTMRSHLFEGARNSDILKDTIGLNVVNSKNNLAIELKNLTPHKAPTGFGGRSIEIKIVFEDENSVISTKTYNLEAIYENKHGQETVPYLATSIKSDSRLEPNEIRKLNIPKPPNATSAKITMNYRLVRGRLLEIINFTDPIFDADYLMKEVNVKL